MLQCESCGFDVCSVSQALSAIKREYDEVFEIYVYHIGCAISEGLIDVEDANELDEDFYWEAI